MQTNKVNVGQELKSLVKKIAQLHADSAKHSIGFMTQGAAKAANRAEQKRFDDLMKTIAKKKIVLDYQTKDAIANEKILRQTEMVVNTLRTEFSNPITAMRTQELIEEFHDEVNKMIVAANNLNNSPRTR